MSDVVFNTEHQSYDGTVVSRERHFKKSEWFSHCPFCGAKDTIYYEPDSELDYGGGEFQICTVCGDSFYGYAYHNMIELANRIARAILESAKE